jgi:transposase-like protein
MQNPETISLYDFFKRFPDDEAANLYFEGKRWSNGKYCPHCGGFDVVACKDKKPMPYRCKDCRKHFSVRTGTVLEESRLPLHKWLMAIYMMTTARKGIPSTQMARELGITQKSAWFLAQRIREAWLATDDGGDGSDDKIDGDVEVDETFIGGKEKNKHSSSRLRQGRGSVGKAIVVGMKQRGGIVIAKHVSNTSAKTLQGFIGDNVMAGANVYTDNFKSYCGLKGYNRLSVNHSVGEYVKAQAHTNGIESFWALLKRGYYGIFHHMSPKHLHRYVNEFGFRHNTASTGTMGFIDATVKNMANRRLTYKGLVHA